MAWNPEAIQLRGNLQVTHPKLTTYRITKTQHINQELMHDLLPLSYILPQDNLQVQIHYDFLVRILCLAVSISYIPSG